MPAFDHTLKTEIMREYTEREKWFIDRIGKVVYRQATTCQCEICKSVVLNGLMIHDEYHALYLCEMEEDYTESEHPIRYQDYPLL